jgi:hypothetical protein
MDQGSCACDYAFTAVGALEGHFARKNEYLLQLSPQNIIDCTRDDDFGNFGCQGGNTVIAYEYVQNNGIAPAAFYTYRAQEALTCSFTSKMSVGKLVNFVEVESGNETALMYALYRAGGPLAVAIDSSPVTFRNYHLGVYDYENCTNDPNHSSECDKI